jgi:hypothetical protein
VGFEPAIPAAKRPQTYVLDLAATGIDIYQTMWCKIPKDSHLQLHVMFNYETRRDEEYNSFLSFNDFA